MLLQEPAEPHLGWRQGLVPVLEFLASVPILHILSQR